MARPVDQHDGVKKRCACGRSKWPKCRHPWHFTYQWRGEQYAASLAVLWPETRGEVVPRTNAERMYTDWRGRIHAGTWLRPKDAKARPADPATITVGDVARRYERDYVNLPTRTKASTLEMRSQLRRMLAVQVERAGRILPMADLPMSDVRTADVDTVREQLRARLDDQRAALDEVAKLTAQRDHARAEVARLTAAKRTIPEAVLAAAETAIPSALRKAAGRARQATKGGARGRNACLTRLRHVFAWAIARDLVEHSPFRKAGVALVKMETETHRTRRLVGDEEARLLAAAGPHLQAVIVGAMTTGLRRAELLGLQWRDISTARREITLRAETTKTKHARTVPLVSRCAAMLEMRRTGPDGQPLADTAHVFGDDTGRRLHSVKTAWRTACAKAGIVDLHLHDLRREAASRWLEAGVPLHQVSRWLGHTNLATTAIYLATNASDGKRWLSLIDPEIPSNGRAKAEHGAPPVPEARAEDARISVQ